MADHDRLGFSVVSTDADLFETADLLDIKVGEGKKADPADVAQIGLRRQVQKYSRDLLRRIGEGEIDTTFLICHHLRYKKVLRPN